MGADVAGEHKTPANSETVVVTLQPGMNHHNSINYEKQNNRSSVDDQSHKPPDQCSSTGMIQQGNI